MQRWLVVITLFMSLAAFPWTLQGADNCSAAGTQSLTFEKLFGSSSTENVTAPSISTDSGIPGLSPLFDPIIVKMLQPLLKQSWEYPATPMPVANSEPSLARPIGVGPLANGGKLLNLRVGLGQFEYPVDLYFVLLAPAIDPDHFFIMRPDDSLEAYSVEGLRKRKIKKLDKVLDTLKGIQPWKKATTGNLNVSLVSDLPAINLPSGTYETYLIAAQAGATKAYYQWKTEFVVKNFNIPDMNIIPPWPSNWDWFLYKGDLTVKSAVPVQVVDGWPGVSLVKGKGTVFRVNIYSTFNYDVDAHVSLILPYEFWSYVGFTYNPLHRLTPHGWNAQTQFGPFTIKAREETEIILPQIPGNKDDPVSIANPYGVAERWCNDDGLCHPDVRVLPTPIVANQQIDFTVIVDPDNSVEESDEGNNTYSPSHYDSFWIQEVIETRPLKVLFVPMRARNCSPGSLQDMDTYARYAAGFMLGMFPIADGWFSYQIVPPVQVFPCDSDQNSGDCGCRHPSKYCLHAIIEDEATIGSVLDNLAREWGADIAFGVFCGAGGQSKTTTSAVVGLDISGFTNAAHEAMHVFTGNKDLYFLDCKAGPLEAYAEFRFGTYPPWRSYCCDVNQPNVNAGAPLCYHSDPNDDYSPVSCDYSDTTKNCNDSCDLSKSLDDCFQACTAAWPGAPVFTNADYRVKPLADRGFWANQYVDIDPRGNPADPVLYIMDFTPGTTWGLAPNRWVRMNSSQFHCTGQYSQDGYVNLLFKFFVLP